MATYHLSAKIGKVGTAGKHAAYICREGDYSKKPDCENVTHGNFPNWAEGDPLKFWQMADEHERVNGSVYREFESALPRELTPAQRVQLVQDFVSQKIGARHAYSFAIHNPKAAIEGGEQPHAHVMYSERIIDGIERAEDLFFKRYNAKAPERGGCQKVNRGVTAAARAGELVDTRALWGEIQNAHLAKHGHVARVDHRSLEAQGIERVAEPHIGPNRRDLFPLVKAQREQGGRVQMEELIDEAHKKFSRYVYPIDPPTAEEKREDLIDSLATMSAERLNLGIKDAAKHRMKMSEELKASPDKLREAIALAMTPKEAAAVVKTQPEPEQDKGRSR